jgi:NAD(P)-dependent dehydrogenase (short-subunit alcohol dehydrogenase family)
MDMNLRSRTVVVTGGSGALGSAIARRFASEGVAVVAIVDLDEAATAAAASALAAEQRAAGRADTVVVPVVVDVTDHDAVQLAYAELAKRFGRIDVAINNAGIVAPSARLHNVKVEDFRRVLDVNLVGIFNCMKAAIVAMRADGRGGAIVNTASVAGFTTWTHSSPYGASKAAVIQLTKLGAAEYAADGIRVNCVSPGTFITKFHDQLSPDALDAMRDRHPLGRFGSTDEIADAYVYLSGGSAGWVTGTNLVIDGGMAIG